MITYQTEILLRESEGVDLLRDDSWSTSVGGCPSNIYLQASGTQDGRSFFHHPTRALSVNILLSSFLIVAQIKANAINSVSLSHP